MRVAVLVVAAAICGGCTASAGGPVPFERTIDVHGKPVVVRIMLQPEHRDRAQRFLDGAEAAVRAASAWTPIAGPLQLEDPPLHPRPRPATPGVIVLPPTPWWSTPTSMSAERAVVQAITAHAIASAFDASRLPSWFIAGLVEYRTREVVMGLFSRDNTSPGYMMFEPRYFGGFVPRFTRVRLLPDRDNEPLTAFRARPTVDPGSGDSIALAGKTVAVLTTLQRWLGAPMFDAVIVRWLARRDAPPTLEDLARLAGDASGQDLAWLLDQAFGSAKAFDYGVADLTSTIATGGGFDTRVTVARFGEASFTGRTASRVGAFESGTGVAVLISFADGEHVRESWDGRDARKTYIYKSAARAVSAVVDPENVIALDMKRTNNSIATTALTATASVRWSARWMTWLQNALLTYAALV